MGYADKVKQLAEENKKKPKNSHARRAAKKGRAKDAGPEPGPKRKREKPAASKSFTYEIFDDLFADYKSIMDQVAKIGTAQICITGKPEEPKKPGLEMPAHLEWVIRGGSMWVQRK